jgi:hypothetical protein
MELSVDTQHGFYEGVRSDPGTPLRASTLRVNSPNVATPQSPARSSLRESVKTRRGEAKDALCRKNCALRGPIEGPFASNRRAPVDLDGD